MPATILRLGPADKTTRRIVEVGAENWPGHSGGA